MRSLRHALGPNFGSLCLAAWLLNLLQVGRGVEGCAVVCNNMYASLWTAHIIC
jgi:hypothetical protein